MSAQKIAIEASKSSEWFPELPSRLDEAVESYGIENSSDFQVLRDLSAATRFEAIDVDSDSAIVQGNRWAAPATIYVTLVYDPNNDPVEIGDSYPATVYFHISDNHAVKIEKIDPDVRSFYE